MGEETTHMRNKLKIVIEKLENEQETFTKVPLNEVGFFEGRLVHQERVYVKLGRRIVAECSNRHAQSILSRRLESEGGNQGEVSMHRAQITKNDSFENEKTEYLEEKIQNAPGEIQALTEKEAMIEKTPKTEEEILDMLERLEQLELENTKEIEKARAKGSKGLKRGFLLKSDSKRQRKPADLKEAPRMEPCVVETTVKEHNPTHFRQQTEKRMDQENRSPARVSRFRQQLLEKEQRKDK